MNKNKKLVLIGSVVAVIVIALITVVAMNGKESTKDKKDPKATERVSTAKPGEDADVTETPAATATETVETVVTPTPVPTATPTPAPTEVQTITTESANGNGTVTKTEMSDGSTQTIYKDNQGNSSNGGLNLEQYPENDRVDFNELFPNATTAPNNSSQNNQDPDSGWGDMQ